MPTAARQMPQSERAGQANAVRRPVRPPAGAARPATPSAPAAAPPAKRRWLTADRVFLGLAALVIYLGWKLPTQRYLTPKSGFGYALGIIGGSCVLLLLLYSLRKRVRWLAFMGSVARWFEVHMVLGVLAPICILYHANFSTGATNSNVALFCMLIVAGSGLIGRYIYTHIHFGLYGRKMSLGELRSSADRLRTLESTIAFLPELVSRLEAEEKRLLASGPRLPVLSLLKPATVTGHAVLSRWRLHRYVSKALKRAARSSPTIAAQRRRLRRTAFAYVDRRLAATRHVAEFEAYERLFSLWHVLHLPLFFMLLIAGIVHVIAVNVY